MSRLALELSCSHSNIKVEIFRCLIASTALEPSSICRKGCPLPRWKKTAGSCCGREPKAFRNSCSSDGKLLCVSSQPRVWFLSPGLRLSFFC